MQDAPVHCMKSLSAMHLTASNISWDSKVSHWLSLQPWWRTTPIFDTMTDWVNIELDVKILQDAILPSKVLSSAYSWSFWQFSCDQVIFSMCFVSLLIVKISSCVKIYSKTEKWHFFGTQCLCLIPRGFCFCKMFLLFVLIILPCAAHVIRWRGRALDFAISRSRVQILLEAILRNNLRQFVYTYVPLSPSSITWYRSKGGDALRLGR